MDETRSNGAVAAKVTKIKRVTAENSEETPRLYRDCSLKLGLRTFITCISVFYHGRI